MSRLESDACVRPLLASRSGKPFQNNCPPFSSPAQQQPRKSEPVISVTNEALAREAHATGMAKYRSQPNSRAPVARPGLHSRHESAVRQLMGESLPPQTFIDYPPANRRTISIGEERTARKAGISLANLAAAFLARRAAKRASDGLPVSPI